MKNKNTDGSVSSSILIAGILFWANSTYTPQSPGTPEISIIGISRRS